MAISEKFQILEKLLQGVKEREKKNRLPTDVEAVFFKKRRKKLQINIYFRQQLECITRIKVPVESR